MYEIPEGYLVENEDPKTKIKYYTFNKESLDASIKKLYKPEKLAEFQRSIETVRTMIENPFYSTALSMLGEDEQRKILREIILKDSEKLNAEIHRLLKINPAFIGTKQMRKMMELSTVYDGFFNILIPKNYEKTKNNNLEQLKEEFTNSLTRGPKVEPESQASTSD